MTFGERFHRWNLWYDELPQEWRFQFVLWPLIALGAINILLTVSSRFPFGLLLLLGIIVLAAVRVPYMLNRLAAANGAQDVAEEPPRFQISGFDWLIELNQRYEAMPELRRFWVLPIVLLIAGAINMLLTIGNRFPFGLLFLLALLAMVAGRAPYVAGWLKQTPSDGGMIAAGSESPGRDQSLVPGHTSPSLSEPLSRQPDATGPATTSFVEPPRDDAPEGARPPPHDPFPVRHEENRDST
jgi:hypothetical protein